MSKFIELTTDFGRRYLFNTATIDHVGKHPKTGQAFLYFISDDTESIRCKESYDYVAKQLLES